DDATPRNGEAPTEPWLHRCSPTWTCWNADRRCGQYAQRSFANESSRWWLRPSQSKAAGAFTHHRVLASSSPAKKNSGKTTTEKRKALLNVPCSSIGSADPSTSTLSGRRA